MLYQGDKVTTLSGDGVIVYVRFAPPLYNKVQAASVLLDNKKDNIGYRGTIFSANDIKKKEV